MVKTGTMLKSKKQQKLTAQLRLLIENFADAMWTADKSYIASTAAGKFPRFTPKMYFAWNDYLDFCQEHKDDKI